LLVDLRLWILDHLIQKNYVLLEGLLLLVNVGQDTLKCAFVGCDFSAEAGFSLMDEVTMVLPFNTSLETECNEQTDGDGREVEKKVAPTMNRFVRGMDIDHGRNLFQIHWPLA
jgi:hypothetical protein